MKLTPEQITSVLADPEKVASVIYSLAQQPDLEEWIEEHGMEKVVELALEVAVKQYGGEA